MKINPVLLAYTAAGLAGLFVAYKLATAATKGAQAVAETAKNVVTRDLNPASQENVVNRSVSAVGAAVSGDKEWSLGGWFAKLTGADKDAEIAAMLKGSDVQAAQDRYQRPPMTAAVQPEVYIDQAPVSFYVGGTFKDLASPQGVNPFFFADPYGGGLSLK